jgi:glycosyltransferase involved in cell wall biosynthesis
VKWAHVASKKIVLSALVNYPGWNSRLRHMVSSLLGPARLRKPMLAAIDRFTVVNLAQARYLVGTIGLPAEKVSVVPNVVDDIFFGAAAGAEKQSFEIENYVLCVGNICRRKNQLTLAQACRKLGVPLLLVGSVLTGEEEHGRVVAESMKDYGGFRWIQGLTSGSARLAAAYRNASVFALPSFTETQPISALEAAASRKPLVLADRPYAKQEFYENALLVDPISVDGLAKSLSKAFDHPEAYCPPAATLEQCRNNRVGAAYRDIYQGLLQT